MKSKKRYFLELAYHGAGYHGWQVQPNAHSVQQELNEKLSILLREAIYVVGSGRTDTGVHCAQQFAHFDTSASQIDVKNLCRRLNAFLPNDIAIRQVIPVKPDAHARFNALSRVYEYKLTSYKSPLMPGLVYFLPKRLHLDAMNQAAALLLNYQDFQAFCKTHTETKTYLCQIEQAFWRQEGELLIFRIKANRFLRGMVRLITGALLEVGTGNLSVIDFEYLINGRKQDGDRKTVPALGLYLTEVAYPHEIFL